MTVVNILQNNFFHFLNIGEHVLVIVFYVDEIVILRLQQHIFIQQFACHL